LFCALLRAAYLRRRSFRLTAILAERCSPAAPRRLLAARSP